MLLPAGQLWLLFTCSRQAVHVSTAREATGKQQRKQRTVWFWQSTLPSALIVRINWLAAQEPTTRVCTGETEQETTPLAMPVTTAPPLHVP
jgi:hypothetical protein